MKNNTIRAVAIAAFLLLLPPVALAKKGENNGKDKGKSGVKVRTKLKAIDGVDTEAKGATRRKAKTQKNGSRDQLKARVNIPVPGNVPPVATEDDASALDLRLRFSRDDASYAECTLVLNKIDSDDGDVEAVYKLDLRSRTNKRGEETFRAKKGSCDTDLDTEGEQSGIPDIQKGDTVTVIQVTDETETSFLSGDF